ncbi:MAG: RodZ domain-containing protein [Cyanobacteria bacterium P01_A01_bin.17]
MSSPEFEEKSAKTLGEVGAHLRAVRQQQSMDLDEISAQTLIPARLLTAIEEGHVQDLPELIYTRGMIRRFANTLGLDGAELVASLGGGQAPQKNLVKSKKGVSGASLKPIHLYLLYIVVIVAAGSGLSYMINQSALTLGEDSVNAPGSESSGGEEPAPEAAASPSPKVNAPATAPEVSSAPLRIDLSVKQDAWIEIFVDGEKNYAGTLTAGTNRTITGQKKLVVRSGNAGGVLLAVNKKPAQLMGKLGAVKEVVIEPENTNQSNQAINPNITAEG